MFDGKTMLFFLAFALHMYIYRYIDIDIYIYINHPDDSTLNLSRKGHSMALTLAWVRDPPANEQNGSADPYGHNHLGFENGVPPILRELP
jgi:hypothetical protein